MNYFHLFRNEKPLIACIHLLPLSERNIEHETRGLTERGSADAVIVTGNRTGSVTNIDELKKLKQNTHLPVLVGSYFKKNGKASNFIEEEKVKEFVRFILR